MMMMSYDCIPLMTYLTLKAFKLTNSLIFSPLILPLLPSSLSIPFHCKYPDFPSWKELMSPTRLLWVFMPVQSLEGILDFSI